MKRKELQEYVFQLDNLLPVLIEHFQISDPHKLFGIKITLQQYLTLDVLAKKGKCMITELSKILGVALSTMTELTGRLVKGRFVEKIRDKRDRRIVRVNLTVKGLEIIQKINLKKQRHIAVILERLVQRDRKTLINILKIVSNAVKEKEVLGVKA